MEGRRVWCAERVTVKQSLSTSLKFDPGQHVILPNEGSGDRERYGRGTLARSHF